LWPIAPPYDDRVDVQEAERLEADVVGRDRVGQRLREHPVFGLDAGELGPGYRGRRAAANVVTPIR
jgi:hypothetical protein